MAVKYCSECGAPMDTDASVCGICGTPARKKTAGEQAEPVSFDPAPAHPDAEVRPEEPVRQPCAEQEEPELIWEQPAAQEPADPAPEQPGTEPGGEAPAGEEPEQPEAPEQTGPFYARGRQAGPARPAPDRSAAYTAAPPAQPQDPVSLKEWLLAILISLIPVAGLIMLCIWAFGDSVKPSKKQWARAMLIVQAVAIAVLAVLLPLLAAALFLLPLRYYW